MPRQLNPAKLVLSKWTAAQPRNKEKHFIVTKVVTTDDDRITHCIIEAVHSGREREIDWRELQDSESWLRGWV